MSDTSVQLTHVTSASNDKFTAMLVNAILNDHHEDARMAQDVIKARSMAQTPEYTKNLDNIIASGLNSMGVTPRDKSTDVGVA